MIFYQGHINKTVVEIYYKQNYSSLLARPAYCKTMFFKVKQSPYNEPDVISRKTSYIIIRHTYNTETHTNESHQAWYKKSVWSIYNQYVAHTGELE